MKLGMNTVIFGSVDLETALQHVEWAGFEYVELAAIRAWPSTSRLATTRSASKICWAQHNLTVTATEAATNDRERLQGIFKLASDLASALSTSAAAAQPAMKNRPSRPST
jgi:sugar phosphate isomerase/epimerase